MYTKDKNHRITLRLNDEQMDFVRRSSELLDCSPSDFLRMVINLTLSGAKRGIEFDKEGFRRENEEANINRQL